MSDIAESIFKEILNGNFQGNKMNKLSPDKLKSPLYLLSHEEVELYAKLNNIKGKNNKRDKKIQKLFNEFKKNNKDLEHNIINASMVLFSM